MRRASRAASLTLASIALAAGWGATAAVGAVTADNNNPCDVSPSLPYCDSALGPLRDVTANWRDYQPALTQPVPISDYCATEPTCAPQPTCPADPTCAGADPEDQAPVGSPTVAAAGWCGTETVHQAATGPQIPASTEVAALPPGVSAPPGKYHPYAGSHYCMLRYIPDDFAPLCAGCHRILIDFAALATGTYNSTSPAADGHWAARFSTDSSFSATTPVNEHSPNIKNLCADKYFNPGAGATCVPYIAPTDLGAHEFEGDATIFHHFPFEGRYYNGPAYLAGDGVTVPQHWVNGAFFDVDPAGATSLPVWYNAGYRGLGDTVPDTDQSYGCPCEAPGGIVPGVQGSGHTTWSPSLVLAASTNPAATPTTSPTVSSAPLNSSSSGPAGTPNTAAGSLPLVPPLVLLAVAALISGKLARRRSGR